MCLPGQLGTKTFYSIYGEQQYNITVLLATLCTATLAEFKYRHSKLKGTRSQTRSRSGLVAGGRKKNQTHTYMRAMHPVSHTQTGLCYRV